MLAVEDILAAIVSRGRWFDIGERDCRDPDHQKMSGVLRELTEQLATLNGDRLYDQPIPPNVIERFDPNRPASYARGAANNAPHMETASGTQTRKALRDSGFSAIASEAVAGMPSIEWASILWVIDSDEKSYKIMKKLLVRKAAKSIERDKFWPESLRRSDCICGRSPAEDYVPDLVKLALYELRTPALYQTHQQRAEWFGLSSQHWRKILHKPYGFLQGQVFLWFGSGCGHIARRLRRSSQAVHANNG